MIALMPVAIAIGANIATPTTGNTQINVSATRLIKEHPFASLKLSKSGFNISIIFIEEPLATSTNKLTTTKAIVANKPIETINDLTKETFS